MRILSASLLFLSLLVSPLLDVRAELRAGAAIVDITPDQLPVIVNGGLVARTVDNVGTRLNARALVLDDGTTRIAIVVVDSCMTPRPLLDEIKQLASERSGIQPDRMLISATHTHSAPSIMFNMVAADPTYVPYLRLKVAEAIIKAAGNLQPARAGWGSIQAPKFTALRRWIYRPDRIANDVFGNPTVRATMHAGSNLDNVTGISGPEDPELAVISIQSTSGRPLALLANFSMHYFSGEKGLSADYYGLFCQGIETSMTAGRSDNAPPMVAIMSHGCSGDVWRRDYSLPPEERYEPTISGYANDMVQLVLGAHKKIEHRADLDLAMAERRMQLDYRVPNQQRLTWARAIVEKMGDREPVNQVEAYAREQLILDEKKTAEVVVQAIRIGSMAITTTPTETYALTGLKLKLQSPLENTMVLDLANGADGYIPPPEQHVLGGYNTWEMRGAGLEIAAETKMTQALLELLEETTGKPRRAFRQTRGPGADATLKARPAAYWRLDDFEGRRAVDSSGNNRDGRFEPGVVFFLDGPASEHLCLDGEQNRAAHFAGGRMAARVAGLGESYSVAIWFWNGMPAEARPISGWMFSRGRDKGLTRWGDHLGLGGGRLVFQHGREQVVRGTTGIARWSWNHAVLVRDGEMVRVYLNGNPEAEIEVRTDAGLPVPFDQVFVGGRSDEQSGWEGRLDEAAIFDRPLSPREIRALVP